MRFLIQRVKKASVSVNGQVKGAIEHGFLVFVGVREGDGQAEADKLIKKLLGLRIFEDEKGKTNLSLSDVDGSLLIVSQFTLYADCKKGYRPSFMKSGDPLVARNLYEYVVSECKKNNYNVQTGVFGEHMEVQLLNDGPFTIWLDSDEL